MNRHSTSMKHSLAVHSPTCDPSLGPGNRKVALARAEKQPECDTDFT